MIVKSLWTTLVSTGAVSVALAATLSFNGVLTDTGTHPHEGQINTVRPAYSGLGMPTATATSPPSDTTLVNASLATEAGISVVVIDAGHGGRDLGCQGTTHGTQEKEIALEIALGLGERIRERHPDIQVVFTRDTDVFVPLHQRAQIANRAQADLFLSLHCNALPSTPKIRGSESYVMGLHTAQHNLDVAKRENAAIHLEDEGLDSDHYDFDPNSPAGHITLSMFQHAFLEQSMALAADIEDALGARDGHRSRGVKQAGFLVLKETAMPSVLVETGYLTNPSEEAYLNGHDGQAATIEALYRGVESYMQQRRRDGREAQPIAASQSQEVVLQASLSNGPIQNYVPAPGVAPTPSQQRLSSISEPDRKLEAHIATSGAPVSEALPTAAEAPSTTTPAKRNDESTISPSTTKPEPKSTFPVVSNTSASNSNPPTQEEATRVGLEVYVQLSASAKQLNTTQGKWASIQHPVRSLREGNFLKYQAGPFATVEEADAARRVARRGDFPDAFTIGYRNGVKLSRAELSALR